MKQPKSGVKEVVIPPLEIISEIDAKQGILEMFKTHKELTCYQMCKALHIPYNTARRRCQEMVIDGILECRYVIAKINGRNRQVAVYTLAKSSQGNRRRA